MNKRLVTFGKQPSKPEGMFKEIHFPVLANLDTPTQEGVLRRFLSSEGGEVRNLPRTIYMQTAQLPQHAGAVAVGAIYEATLDAEAGVLRDGKGWLVDLPIGHEAAVYVASGALQHNSIDLSEIQVRVDMNFDNDEFPTVDMHFDKWKMAATTLVGKPAFADASAIIPDEITAALESDEPLVCDVDHVITFSLAEEPEEIMAALATAPSWDHFHRPEADIAHKVIVGTPDDNGWTPVYGHLGLWNTQHDGVEWKAVTIPRPRDNYASFNKAGVLTDRGQVETGPICLKGGHVPLAKAIDSVEHAWADVRVTAGRHGPWLCGVVRPGTSDEDVYAARASRLSGHWKSGRLKAIVSVNAEGFDVPGNGTVAPFNGFAFQTNTRGEVTELVASFPGDDEPQTDEFGRQLPPPMVKGPAWILDSWNQFVNSGNQFWTTTSNSFAIDITNPVSPVTTTPGVDPDFEFRKRKTAMLIALDDEEGCP